jgi:hypothetical protein
MRGRGHGRVVIFLRGAIVLAVLMLRPLAASAAPVLLGDSVQGSIYSEFTIVTQFTSPSVVGDGVEFTGVMEDHGKARRNWQVSVDIGARGFTIGWNMPIPDAESPLGGWLTLGLSLTGLNFTEGATITGVTQTGYYCGPGLSGCAHGESTVPPVSFTGDSVVLEFGRLFGGQTYTYEFTVSEPTITPVPEPASLALLGTGFATLIAGRRRRRTNLSRTE